MSTGPSDAFDPKTEVAIPTPKGEFVVVESATANPHGTSYVRIVDHLGDTGKELAYWICDEWGEEPENVMGAIFGAIVGGAKRN